MTTYDDVWTSFRNKCKIDDLDLPTSNEAIYDTIYNSILIFNNKLEDNLSGDNTSEMLNRELTGNELLVLSYSIRLIILENQLIYYSATFSPFTKEIGTRNLAKQMSSLQYLVEREDQKIDAILLKMIDYFV